MKNGKHSQTIRHRFGGFNGVKKRGDLIVLNDLAQNSHFQAT